MAEPEPVAEPEPEPVAEPVQESESAPGSVVRRPCPQQASSKRGSSTVSLRPRRFASLVPVRGRSGREHATTCAASTIRVQGAEGQDAGCTRAAPPSCTMPDLQQRDEDANQQVDLLANSTDRSKVARGKARRDQRERTHREVPARARIVRNAGCRTDRARSCLDDEMPSQQALLPDEAREPCSDPTQCVHVRHRPCKPPDRNHHDRARRHARRAEHRAAPAKMTTAIIASPFSGSPSWIAIATRSPARTTSANSSTDSAAGGTRSSASSSQNGMSRYGCTAQLGVHRTGQRAFCRMHVSCTPRVAICEHSGRNSAIARAVRLARQLNYLISPTRVGREGRC